MYNPLEKEIWKNYPLNFEFEGVNRVEVSNLGRVKSFNKHYPEGNILKGSLQAGFPIIKLRFFKKRTDIQIKKIEVIQNKIDDLNLTIKSHVNENPENDTLQKLRTERDLEIQRRKKLNNKFNKSREINVAFLVHKAVAELFLPAPKDLDKTFIIHKDFVKENNTVDNLEWANQKELSERANKHPKTILHNFKRTSGESLQSATNAKLTEKDVLYIKTKLKKGITAKALAKRFDVSEMQIHRIKTGENWKHVELIEDLKKRHKKWQAT